MGSPGEAISWCTISETTLSERQVLKNLSFTTYLSDVRVVVPVQIPISLNSYMLPLSVLTLYLIFAVYLYKVK